MAQVIRKNELCQGMHHLACGGHPLKRLGPIHNPTAVTPTAKLMQRAPRHHPVDAMLRQGGIASCNHDSAYDVVRMAY